MRWRTWQRRESMTIRLRVWRVAERTALCTSVLPLLGCCRSRPLQGRAPLRRAIVVIRLPPDEGVGDRRRSTRAMGPGSAGPVVPASAKPPARPCVRVWRGPRTVFLLPAHQVQRPALDKRADRGSGDRPEPARPHEQAVQRRPGADQRGNVEMGPTAWSTRKLPRSDPREASAQRTQQNGPTIGFSGFAVRILLARQPGVAVEVCSLRGVAAVDSGAVECRVADRPASPLVFRRIGSIGHRLVR